MLDSDPPTAGDKLLHLFDSDHVIAEEKLVRCRDMLIRRFAAERCHDAEDLADETFKRVVETLEKNPDRVITNIWAFISGVAKNILHETHRSPILKEASLDDLSPAQEPRTVSIEELELAFSRDNDLSTCVKQCLEKLASSERETLIRYYDIQIQDKLKKIRERLALSLGLTSSQLRKHTFKLRKGLEACIKNCLARRNKTQKSS